MTWLITPARPQTAKRFTVIFIFALLALLNIATLFYAACNRNHLMRIQALDEKNIVAMTQMNASLLHVEHTLQQDKNLSRAHFHQLAATLEDMQKTLAALPSQESFAQLQTTLANIQQQLTLNQAAKTTNAVHSKRRAKHAHRKILTPHALPFTVVGIDIWNGEAQVTINAKGQPDLMARNDTRAGWTLTELNFTAARVVFKNRLGQSAIVHVS